MTTHVVMMVVQEKGRSYIERTLGNDFIPLVIKTYKCCHSHFDSFFTTCAQTIIACHQRFSLVPSMFVFYYKQHLSIALQHAQAMAILQQVVTLGWGSSFFPHIIVSAPSLVAFVANDNSFILGLFCYH